MSSRTTRMRCGAAGSPTPGACWPPRRRTAFSSFGRLTTAASAGTAGATPPLSTGVSRCALRVVFVLTAVLNRRPCVSLCVCCAVLGVVMCVMNDKSMIRFRAFRLTDGEMGPPAHRTVPHACPLGTACTSCVAAVCGTVFRFATALLRRSRGAPTTGGCSRAASRRR